MNLKVTRGHQKGYSLIELMIVLVVIGILAALLIPNLLDAKQRARQRATIAEMRNWGIALGAYMSEIGSVPPAAGGGPVDVSTIHNDLVPYAINALDDVDGWGFDFLYYASPTAGVSSNYTVASGGSDDNFDDTLTECISQSTAFIYDYDIVIADGLFICAPS